MEILCPNLWQNFLFIPLPARQNKYHLQGGYLNCLYSTNITTEFSQYWTPDDGEWTYPKYVESYNKNKFRGLSLHANYTDRAAAAGRRS